MMLKLLQYIHICYFESTQFFKDSRLLALVELSVSVAHDEVKIVSELQPVSNLTTANLSQLL